MRRDDRQHRDDAAVDRSEVLRVPGGRDGERPRRRRLPPRERGPRGERRGERGEPLRGQRADRRRGRAAGPRHRADPRPLRPGDEGLGPRMGAARVRPDRRAPDDLLEPELLANEHGRRDVVRRARLPAVDRALGRGRARRPRGELGRPRLDVLAVDLDGLGRGRADARGSRPVQRRPVGAREDRVAHRGAAAGRHDRGAADRLRRRHDHLCAAREPGHLDHPDGDARAGGHAAPVDRRVRCGGGVPHVRRHDARRPVGLGRVRLPDRGAVAGERRGRRDVVARAPGLRRDVRRRVRGRERRDPDGGARLGVGVHGVGRRRAPGPIRSASSR